MPIPDYETLMLPLLRLAAAEKGNEVSLLDSISKLAAEYKLTEEERKELLPSGGTFKFSSRVSWARTYLQKSGLLEATRRGHFTITERGKEVLKKNPLRGSTTNYFHSSQSSENFKARKESRKKATLQYLKHRSNPLRPTMNKSELRSPLNFLRGSRSVRLSSLNVLSFSCLSAWVMGDL